VDKYKDVNSQPILISPRLLLPEAGLSRIKLFTKKLIDGQLFNEISEKAPPDAIPSFRQKQESSIFKAFLGSRFRGSDRKDGFS